MLSTSNLAIKQPDQSYQYSRPVSIRSWRNDTYEALNDAGLEKVAERWLSCSETPKTKIKPVVGAALPPTAEKVYVCSSDHHHEAEVYCQSCDLRICPECARRQAARLVHRYLPTFLDLAHSHHPTYRFRHIVFTSPYALTDPDIREKYLAGFKQVEKVMSGLMAATCPGWKSTQGYLVGAEFGESGHRLHYHVLHYGQYLNQADLARHWTSATSGAASVVFVRGFPYRNKTIEETLREVLKYCVKFIDKDEVTGEITCIPAHYMPLLALCLDKTRRIRTAGLFYNVPEPDRDSHTCATCGAEMVGIPVDYFVTFCNTGFLPLEWRRASTEDGLHLIPADKSSGKTSGISPPEAKTLSLGQRMLDLFNRMRRQNDG